MKLQLLLICAIVLFQYFGSGTKGVCYYESWTSYEGYTPEDFNASLCTHVNYAFVELWPRKTIGIDNYFLGMYRGLFHRVAAMKKRNPNLKLLLSVGGGSEGVAELFAGVVSDPAKKGAFIRTMSLFIFAFKFDGMDIDWKNPSEANRENYITLLHEVRNVFNNHGWLLTVTTSADPVGYAHSIPEMNQIVDWINVKTFEMYGSCSNYTGQCSPLYASSVENDWEKNTLNLAAASNNWVIAGASKDKLAIGVAFYGRSFTLADPNQHGLHAPVRGIGVGDGAPRYHEICEYYNNWTKVWDDEQKNPYIYYEDQWIGYDDPDSISIKADYIKTNGFGGVMIWPINGDDVHGKCGTAQILLKRVNGALEN